MICNQFGINIFYIFIDKLLYLNVNFVSSYIMFLYSIFGLAFLLQCFSYILDTNHKFFTNLVFILFFSVMSGFFSGSFSILNFLLIILPLLGWATFLASRIELLTEEGIKLQWKKPKKYQDDDTHSKDTQYVKHWKRF